MTSASSTYVEIDFDSSTPSSLLSSPSDLGESSQILRVVDSLWDIVTLLPGLILQPSSGYYYVEGKIDEEALYGITKRIGGLTLGEESYSEAPLSLQLLVRMARFHSSVRPLFPNLSFLHISAPSRFLDFLDLFLPSSLSTLELIAITDDDPQYPAVLAFLKSAIVESCLTTLTLGPGQIQDRVLNLTLMNRYLRCLRLLDVDISINDQTLRDIGSLQYLETFVLRVRKTSTFRLCATFPGQDDLDAEETNMSYSSPVFPTRSSTTTMSSESDMEIPSSIFFRSFSHELNVTGIEKRVVEFPALRALEFEGGLSLIGKLLAKIHQSGIQSLSIDLSEPSKSVSDQMDHSIPYTFFIRGKSYSKCKSTFINILRSSVQKWSKTLKFFCLEVDNTMDTFSLPSDILENLILSPNIKSLDLTGMIDINSLGSELGRLANSKLETLHLPMHSTAVGIPLSQLREIAVNYPSLKSLRCQFCSLDIKWVFLPPLTCALEVLSVSDYNGSRVTREMKFKIARFLDSIFPNIKTIHCMHDESAKNSKVPRRWKVISELVKEVCQTVRKDERQRLKDQDSIW